MHWLLTQIFVSSAQKLSIEQHNDEHSLGMQISDVMIQLFKLIIIKAKTF